MPKEATRQKFVHGSLISALVWRKYNSKPPYPYVNTCVHREDMYAQDSIELLTKSGIDFARHQEEGIDSAAFGELFMISGFVLEPKVKWISFHSGYDFAYLLKMLTCTSLPTDEAEFFELLNQFFPCIYDIKYLMKSCKNLKGGLQEVADDLNIARIGPQHQAGSDSLITCETFFRMRKLFFDDAIDPAKYEGYLYGLGPSFVQNSSQIISVGMSDISSNALTPELRFPGAGSQ